MIPAEVLKKVRRIQLATRAIVSDLFAGEYHAAFKGRGMEFEEVREYEPGDDVRSIDWNVTARAGRPFIKRFREERELTVMLVVDASRSQAFGTRAQLKRDLIAELGATIAFSAAENGDKVGLMLFTDHVEQIVPPRKGLRHMLRIVRELLYHPPEGTGTDIEAALLELSRLQRRRAVVFLISDFLAPDFSRALQLIRHRHDLIPVVIRDEREQQLPSLGLVNFRDPETGALCTVDTHSSGLRRSFSAAAHDARQALTTLFRRQRLDAIELQTGASFIEPLRQFFKRRGQRR